MAHKNFFILGKKHEKKKFQKSVQFLINKFIFGLKI